MKKKPLSRVGAYLNARLQITSGRKLVCRLILYVIGLFCLAWGVSFAINGNLGISPVNSIPYILNQIWPALSMGIYVDIIFGLMILAQILLLRKRYNLVDLLQFAFTFLFGVFVDWTNAWIGDFCFPTYLGQLGMLAISIILIALGVLLIVDIRMVPMPSEGLSLAIASLQSKVPFHYVKLITDCVYVAIAITLSLVFLGRLVGIREGTVATAALVGVVIGLLQKPLKPLIERLCFDPPTAQAAGDTPQTEAPDA